MTVQIAVRLTDEELSVLDAEVVEGRAENRSDVVRRSIAYIERRRGYRNDRDIMARLAAAGEKLYPDLDGLPPTDLAGLD